VADVELRRLRIGDDAIVLDAAALFDKPPLPAATAAFLAADDHHLILALLDGRPAGFVSGVEMLHPDKGRRCSCTSWVWPNPLVGMASGPPWSGALPRSRATAAATTCGS
jgi:hypothetical protein